MWIGNFLGRKSNGTQAVAIGNGGSPSAVVEEVSGHKLEAKWNVLLVNAVTIIFIFVIGYLAYEPVMGWIEGHRSMVSSSQHAVRQSGSPAVAAAASVPTGTSSIMEQAQALAQRIGAVPETLLAQHDPAVRGVDRDVFKDFYAKHPSNGGSGALDLTEKLPELPKGIGGNFGPMPLPLVQAVSAPGEEKTVELRISGTTCDTADTCTAITSEGVLKVGDKIGAEVVEGIGPELITTNKRKIEFH